MLRNKVAVVTGGSSGIGRAMTRTFVREGARVVIPDLDVKRAEALAQELGGPGVVLAVKCDVAKEEDVRAAVEAATGEFGQLDVMVNNAGVVGAVGPIDEVRVDEFDKTIEVDLNGVLLGIKHAARAMKAGGVSGVIINTSSICGLRIMASAGYTAAKSAVIALTQLAACELAPAGIRVNCIAPGVTATPMIGALALGDADAQESLEKYAASATPLKGVALLPQDIANVAVFLASDLARCVNGHTLVVDLGVSVGVTGQVPFMSRLEPAYLGARGVLGVDGQGGRFAGTGAISGTPGLADDQAAASPGKGGESTLPHAR